MAIVFFFRLVPPERLPSLASSFEEVADVIREEKEVLELDKAWHGLHFLFTGGDLEQEPPLGFILNGGEPSASADDSHGAIRVFSPEQLGEISRTLEGLDPAELRRRFDPEAMTRLDIYPYDSWKQGPREVHVYSLLGAFERLKAFLRQGVRQGRGLVIHMPS